MAKTLEQIQQRINALSSNAKIYDKALYLAGKSAMSKLVVRVFSEGKDINGNRYTYDTSRPLYMSDNDLPKNGKHLGKPNDKGKRKKIKNTYFESYKAMRKEMGRESSFMNFRLTNRLQSDMINAPISKDANRIGRVSDQTFTKGRPLELLVLLNKENMAKAKGLNDRTGGKVFAWSKDELKTFGDVFIGELAKEIFK